MKNVGHAIALGAALVVLCGAARATDRDVDSRVKAALESSPNLYAEEGPTLAKDAPQASPADASQSGPAYQAGDPVVVAATRPRPAPWADFDRTVAAAATPDCLGPEPGSDETLSVGGLFRLPLLLHSAVTGGCR